MASQVKYPKILVDRILKFHKNHVTTKIRNINLFNFSNSKKEINKKKKKPSKRVEQHQLDFSFKKALIFQQNTSLINFSNLKNRIRNKILMSSKKSVKNFIKIFNNKNYKYVSSTLIIFKN